RDRALSGRVLPPLVRLGQLPAERGLPRLQLPEAVGAPRVRFLGHRTPDGLEPVEDEQVAGAAFDAVEGGEGHRDGRAGRRCCRPAVRGYRSRYSIARGSRSRPRNSTRKLRRAGREARSSSSRAFASVTGAPLTAVTTSPIARPSPSSGWGSSRMRSPRNGGPFFCAPSAGVTSVPLLRPAAPTATSRSRSGLACSSNSPS